MLKIKVNGKINYIALFISIIIPLSIGFLSALIVGDSFEIYQKLNKPSFAPNASIFSQVWTLLYILMGIASYRVWMYGKEKKEVKSALLVYAFQLILNFLWSILFFGLNLRGVAFIELIILFIFILITIAKFYRIDKISGFLLIPYIIWVGFAAILNFFVWILNL